MSFWYLATAYSKHPDGPVAAFDEACCAAGLLTQARVSVFSPIIQFHTICLWTTLDPLDFRAWETHNKHFMAAARGLIVLMDGEWGKSAGVQAEITWFKEMTTKPIVFMYACNSRDAELRFFAGASLEDLR
jgi:hypothetical protein